MTHVLTESYWPPERPDAVAEVTIGDVLRRAAAEHPDRIGLVWGAAKPELRRSWTYQQILDIAQRLARALLGHFGPGERVAVWAPNSPSYVLLQRSLALAGLILVPVDPAYQYAELRYVLEQSGAVGLLHATEYRGADLAGLAATAQQEIPFVRMHAELEAWVATANGESQRELPTLNPRDPFQIQYTSGTTGFPKGVLLHHMGVLNMARYVADCCDLRDGDVWVSPMPLSHIAGGVTTQLATTVRAGTFVLMPRFDAGLLLELIESCHATITLAVPTMLIAMLEHADFDRRDRASLRTVMSGAATVNSQLVLRTKQRFGCAFTNVYGQTEMHGIVTMTRLDDELEDQATTIGLPLPHVEMKIIDPATGTVCPLGTPGEICTRGYQTMLGYFNMPQATAAAIDSEQWLHSGDLAAMDARGYLSITGKLKDLIIRGGEKIYPREIEEVLFTHPSVSNVAVVGIPDERWGEQVAAVISPVEPDAPPDTEELADFCRQRLARYKSPKFWYFSDHLPLTPSGKVQKVELLQEILRGDVQLAAAS